MAVGDNASAYGYPLVPDTGEEGKVKWGAREINRTRDFVAQVQSIIPTSPQGYQSAAGISAGTAYPQNNVGVDGNIYLQIL